MDILVIMLLIITSIILLLVELFLLPGISIAGILAGGCLLYANYYVFAYMGTLTGGITLAISILASIGSLVLFMRSKTLDRLALKKDIDSTLDRSDAAQVKVGDTGITTTRLALIGYADIHGTPIEVKSIGGFLDEKTPVKVVRITDGLILVDELK